MNLRYLEDEFLITDQDLTHWIPLHKINCAHLGTDPLFKFNGIVYLSRPLLLVPGLFSRRDGLQYYTGTLYKIVNCPGVIFARGTVYNITPVLFLRGFKKRSKSKFWKADTVL